MADLGLQNAFGGEAMAQQVRQRILDQLAAQHQQFQQGIESQRLDIERQRFAQEAADRAQLRQQQQTTFNEGVGEKAGANAGPGQTVMSPAEAAPILGAPSMRGLIKPDQTLPSTQITGSGQAPTTEITPGTQVAGTTPTITQQPSVLTGQLRFMGTPKANAAEAQKVEQDQLLRDPNLTPRERFETRALSAGLKVQPGFSQPTKTESVYSTEPKTGAIRKTGEVPAGSHFISEPTPPAPVNSYQLQPEIDPTTGKQTGRFFSFNTKTNQWEIPQGAGPNATKAAPAGSQTKAEDRQRALSSLDQLDQAVTNAKDLIGPGEGRISSIEQAIGNPDPRIATLGTKLLLAKMQVDAGIGGARAAASPQLLARWDGLLTQKLTPEALHASVQAMREILSEGAPNADAPPPMGPQQPAAADPYQEYLNRRKK